MHWGCTCTFELFAYLGVQYSGKVVFATTGLAKEQALRVLPRLRFNLSNLPLA